MRRMPDLPAVNFAQLSVFADAKRGDDAHAGDGDDRAAGFVALRAGLEAAFGFADDAAMMPSFNHPFEQRQPFAAPIADAGDDDLGQTGRTFPGISAPVGANSLPCSIAAQPIPRLAMNWVSTP